VGVRAVPSQSRYLGKFGEVGQVQTLKDLTHPAAASEERKDSSARLHSDGKAE